MTLTPQKYHHLTSYQRNKMPRQSLDWSNQPSTFKRYPNSRLIRLPGKAQHPNEKLSDILKRSYKKDDATVLKIGDLSRILSLAYSITGKASYGEGYHYYRSVASAGALYPAEIYVATHDIKGLRDGLYHFSIAGHGLVDLRSEDISGWIDDHVYRAPEKRPSLIFFFTTIFFRSAWKYKERAYRYNLLDTGHLVENLTLALKAQRLHFSLSYDFDDQAINQMLGLDETKEVCLAICQVAGSDMQERGDEKEKITKRIDSFKEASIVSNKKLEYPAIAGIVYIWQVL
jgi:SagB-type dehydrogenase family enzyme